MGQLEEPHISKVCGYGFDSHRSYNGEIMHSNQKKSEQLGMPFGTACGRLRKNVMFHLAKKCNENICYHCDLSIDTVEEFSIEHKKQV